MPAMSLGKRIIKARDLRGWDRAELVKHSRVPYPTLAGLENEDQASSKWTPTLAAALGVNALWLAEGKGPMLNDSPNPAFTEPSQREVLASQSVQLDPAILVEAENWALIFEAASGEKWSSLRRKTKEAEVYTQIVADGGKLSDEHHAGFLQEMSKAAQKRTGGGGNERGEESAGRPATRRTGRG